MFTQGRVKEEITIIVAVYYLCVTMHGFGKKFFAYRNGCPGCNSSCIGKTNRTLRVRTEKHTLADKESDIYKHLHHCDQIQHIQGVYNLPDIFTNKNGQPSIEINKEFFTETVRSSTKRIDSDDNWNLLLQKKPTISNV